jgi:hypothetical protein
LTVEGSVLGTPDYLAPEQARDASSSDIRADLYSVGCVLYHCLAGRPPFSDTNIMAQMLKHATERPAPVAALTGDQLPVGFQMVLDRFLAKRPDERYQTPAEASEALAPFAADGAPVSAVKLVPAFQDWLQSESQMEAAKAAKAGTGTKPSAPLPAPVEVTKPVPAGAAKSTAPTKPGTAQPRPASPKPGTAPAPALKPSANVPAQARPAPAPIPAPAPPPQEEEVDVELVTELPAAPPAFSESAAAPAAAVERPLWQPDRRDWIMLAVGACSVLSAVGVGYGLARALKRKDPSPEGSEEKG